jgi:hypothetical protein
MVFFNTVYLIVTSWVSNHWRIARQDFGPTDCPAIQVLKADWLNGNCPPIEALQQEGACLYAPL